MTTLYIFTSLVVVFVISALWLATYLFRRAQELAPHYAEKATLEQDIATAKQNCSQTRLELDNLAASLARAKQDIADAEHQRQWLLNNESTISSLKGQIASTQQTLNDVTQKLNNKIVDLQQVESDLKAKANEIAKKLAELNSSNWLLQSAENKLKESQSEHKRLSEENTTRDAQLQKLLKDVAQRERDLDSVNHKVSEAESQLKSLEVKKQESEKELSRIIARSEEEKRNLKKEVEDLKTEIATLTKERNTVKAKVSELEYELSSIVGKEQVDKKKWEDLDRPIETINKAINVATPKKGTPS